MVFRYQHFMRAMIIIGLLSMAGVLVKVTEMDQTLSAWAKGYDN
jgi:hypothetical protein